jgi:hypothetical protein
VFLTLEAKTPYITVTTIVAVVISIEAIVVTVMYGVFASKVKNTLQLYGVEVTFGAKMFIEKNTASHAVVNILAPKVTSTP